MSEERGVIRAVSWRDVFPGVILFRTFGISAGLWTLLLATVAAIAMTAGWRVSESIFLGDIFNGEETAAADPGESAGSARPTPRFAGRVYERAERERARQKLKEELRDNENLADTALMTRRYPGDRPGPIRGGGTIWQDVPKTPLGIWGTLISGAEPFLTTWANLGRPFVALADRGTTWTQWLYLLCGCLWTLVVWAFFGGAISRMAAVQLAREQRLGFGDAIGHARKKFTGYLAAPLFPIIGIGLTMIPLMIGGLLLMADALTPVAAVLAVLGFLFGLVIVILLLGLIFGWPLMWGTISAEGSDSFDALSRSFAYTFVRPLQYLGYVVIVMMFGALAWLLFDAAATVVVEASYYGTSLTADFATGDGEEVSRTQVVRDAVAAVNTGDESAIDEMSWGLHAGAVVFNFWETFIRSLVTAFAYSYFFVASTGIYLLLRRSADQTEMDEVYMEDEAEAFTLPTLQTDAAGVPAAGDTPPVTTEEVTSPTQEPPAPAGTPGGTADDSPAGPQATSGETASSDPPGGEPAEGEQPEKKDGPG